MIKQFSVTFEFDTETELVSKLTCFADGIEKKKQTTRKAPSKKDEVIEDEAVIIREDNKLILNNKAYLDMGLKSEDRIIIKYEQIAKGKKKFPVIGTDLEWKEEGSGNKVSKTKTVVYRGKVNTILAEYGTTFELERYKETLWKLIPTDKKEDTSISTYEDAVDMAENLDVEMFTTDDDNTEISELTFKL